MTPTDLRDANWERLQKDLSERIWRAYGAWAAHGPGTTREVAARAGWDILSLRPRTTDLYQVGLVELKGRNGNEGIYGVRSQGEWEAWRAEMEEAEGQLQMGLGEPIAKSQ